MWYHMSGRILIIGWLCICTRCSAWDKLEVEMRYGDCTKQSWAVCMCVDGLCHSLGDKSSKSVSLIGGYVVHKYHTIYDLSAYARVTWNGHTCSGLLFTAIVQVRFPLLAPPPPPPCHSIQAPPLPQSPGARLASDWEDVPCSMEVLGSRTGRVWAVRLVWHSVDSTVGLHTC